MMTRGSSVVATTLLLMLLWFSSAAALQLCLNNESPYPLKRSLSFCSTFMQNDTSCCDAPMDQELKATFDNYNVTSAQCGNYLKQILCAQCDPYAADLFQMNLQQRRPVPILCNSTAASNATVTTNSSSKAYCDNVWESCQSVPIKDSPFAPFLQRTGGTTVPQNLSKLSDFWQTQDDFCSSVGGSIGPGDFCFSGEKFTFVNGTAPQTELQGICFEKIGDGVYLNMIPHPDGSNRVFLSSQSGKIWLATLPVEGSGAPLSLNESSPFLDISDRVIHTGEYGLLGVAFHPNFENNGRFFVSYNCDKSLWPDCAGRCACNADAGCALSELGSDAGPIPCQISSVIAEYSANSTSSPSALKATTADPNEVRRIFTMGLPYSTHHAGQILFGPADNYLYFMMGDGGSTGDPFNFAQNKKSLLGKILRFNVDTIPSAEEISALPLWGNYSIPADNPFVQDKTSRPEIWAYGLRNPWRCSFDKINPSYFYCADVGQAVYEEVDLITKGGNYGWRVYEGTQLYTPPRSPGGNTSASSIQPIFPVLGYTHASVNANENSASITGGFVSRSAQDACLYGRYVYADLYGGYMWAAEERPSGSGNYTTARVKFLCADNSSLPCQQSATEKEPNFLYVFSYGEDNGNNLYVLSANGVYKVVSPGACGFQCNATLPAGALVPVPSPTPSVLTPSVSPSASPQGSSGVANLPTWTCNILLLSCLILASSFVLIEPLWIM